DDADRPGVLARKQGTTLCNIRMHIKDIENAFKIIKYNGFKTLTRRFSPENQRPVSSRTSHYWKRPLSEAYCNIARHKGSIGQTVCAKNFPQVHLLIVRYLGPPSASCYLVSEYNIISK